MIPKIFKPEDFNTYGNPIQWDKNWISSMANGIFEAWLANGIFEAWLAVNSKIVYGNYDVPNILDISFTPTGYETKTHQALLICIEPINCDHDSIRFGTSPYEGYCTKCEKKMKATWASE